jgi:hypothetical protein
MRFQLPLAVLLTVPTVACTTDSGAPNEDDLDGVTEAIERENGGYDTSDEAPMFGDEALYAAADIEAEATVSDSLATDPVIIQLQQTASVVAREVVVMWGRMPADPDAAPRTWSGELRLSRGGMLVQNRIAFEDAADRLLPRVRRDAIAFQSVTRAHADGLVLTVFDPTPTAADPLVLTYVAADASATYTIDLGTLEAGPVSVDAGAGAQLVAIAHVRQACDHGFLRGRWRAFSEKAGHYAGIVVDSAGKAVGHMRGIYGVRISGEAVFFGKLIGADGSFKGIIRGSFEAQGFEGRWLDRAGDHGLVRGLYRAGDTLRGGQFLGRWAEAICRS